MSNDIQNPLENPTKNWKDYGQEELQRYIFRNMNKTDCNIVVKDPNNKMPEKVLKSFKWILCDMSTILTTMLNDETNQANNIKLISTSDTNFEGVITFGHTKKVDESFDLFDLYESAIIYEIQPLKTAIYAILISKIKFKLNWINFYRIIHIEEHPQWQKELTRVFNQISETKAYNAQHMERDLKLESNIKLILDFDFVTFDKFLCYITKTRPLKAILCFKIAEAYLIKHVFNEKAPNTPEEQDNITKNTVQMVLEKIPFKKMSLTEFRNGPEKSNLLDTTSVKNILKKYFKYSLMLQRIQGMIQKSI